MTLWHILVPTYYIKVLQNTGISTISPGGTASACLGEQLELTCDTTGNFLEWSFNLIYENGTSRRSMLTIQSIGESDQMHQFRINSITFTSIRISTRGSLPLMSNLTISPVTRGLNGTPVNCEDQETGELSSTVISIISGTVIIHTKSTKSCHTVRKT